MTTDRARNRAYDRGARETRGAVNERHGQRDGREALFHRLFNTIRKHTQRAAWRGVAASRMADWRRADDSRSVSVLGRGRGDRCWLVTRAGGCPPEGERGEEVEAEGVGRSKSVVG